MTFRPRQAGIMRPIVDGKLQCLACGQWEPLADYLPRPPTGKRKSIMHESRCTPCRRLKNVARNMNLTIEAYQARLKASDGRCEICRRDMPSPFLDHNHDTGQLRGVLCVACNSALGLLRESVPTLESAIGYLQKYSALNAQTPVSGYDEERKRRMDRLRSQNLVLRQSRRKRRKLE